MKVLILGENYTGAHFRMLRDPIDGTAVELELEGDGRNIARYIVENFGYSCEVESWEQFLTTMKDDNSAYGMFDGAGGIFWIKDEAGNEIWKMDTEGLDTFRPPQEGIKLGCINVDELGDPDEQRWYNHVNRLLDAERAKDVDAWDKRYNEKMKERHEKVMTAMGYTEEQKELGRAQWKETEARMEEVYSNISPNSPFQPDGNTASGKPKLH